MAFNVFATTYELENLLSPISAPVARTFSLSYLSKHFPLLIFSFVTFQVVQWLSPLYLFRLSPVHFGRANAALKHDWTSRIVSTVHAAVIMPLAFSCLHIPELENDKAFGFNERVGGMAAIACGYFLWDTLESIVHFRNIGFVLHGLSCLMVYLLSFRPFLGYYSARFLLWELSTPFVNIHWYLDKTNRRGGYLQIANGVILLTSFFITRIYYGGLTSLQFLYTLLDVKSEIPGAMTVIYVLGNVVLQALNWVWFYKMILILRRRCDPNATPRRLHKDGDAVLASSMNGKMKSN